ncbi:hypothetical protein E4U43_006151, partial [Claviceps pusilla]
SQPRSTTEAYGICRHAVHDVKRVTNFKWMLSRSRRLRLSLVPMMILVNACRTHKHN